ncbi:hypothetical protein ACFX2J_007062 [Malus domestica]
MRPERTKRTPMGTMATIAGMAMDCEAPPRQQQLLMLFGFEFGDETQIQWEAERTPFWGHNETRTQRESLKSEQEAASNAPYVVLLQRELIIT